jgi:large subunit ribosomal protein L10
MEQQAELIGPEAMVAQAIPGERVLELRLPFHVAITGNLAGMTSMAYTMKDPVALAKALTAYAKTNPTFTFKAGLVEGRVIEVKSIQDLASMPSREEIFAKVLFLIQAPAQRLVTAINGVGRNLAVVVNQGVKEGKFSQ